MPVSPVKDNAAGAPLFDKLQPNREDREFVLSREHGCNLRLHNVSACKLMRSGIDAKGVAHVGNATASLIKAYIAVAVNAAQGHGEQVAAAPVFCQQIMQRDISQNIAVVDNERALLPQRENFFNAAAGVQRFFFMA